MQLQRLGSTRDTRFTSQTFALCRWPVGLGTLLLLALTSSSVEAGLLTYSTSTAWQSAVPGASLEDFEGIAHGSLSNQVSGLTFSAFQSGNPRVSSAVSAQSGLNVVEVNPGVSGAFDGGGGVQIGFATPQASVAISYLDSEFSGNSITLLDSADQVLGTFAFQYPFPDVWLFAGFVSTSGANISKIQIGVDGRDYVAFDDLQFSSRPSPAPAPGSLILLATGGLTVAAGHCWRKRRVAVSVSS